jgi:hypothetical protein
MRAFFINNHYSFAAFASSKKDSVEHRAAVESAVLYRVCGQQQQPSDRASNRTIDDNGGDAEQSIEFAITDAAYVDALSSALSSSSSAASPTSSSSDSSSCHRSSSISHQRRPSIRNWLPKLTTAFIDNA